jgi:hypothetical protein
VEEVSLRQSFFIGFLVATAVPFQELRGRGGLMPNLTPFIQFQVAHFLPIAYIGLQDRSTDK